MATAPAAELGERLAEIVGPEHVTVAPDIDVDGVRPRLAGAPATLEEAALVLQAAREAGAAVTPWGGGTQQRLGTPPARLDLVLRTERLRGVVDWEPADLTAGLRAGMTLAAVQAALAEQGQQLPLDAPLAERATLGGLVATNTSGPRRWQYGGWRDLIVGMEMALTDGTVIKSGGRVVKNVQGYDLAKLFTGALGTLGVIGRINVKLVPLPAARRLLVARGELQAVARFLATAAASQARLASIDLLDDAAARVCGLGASRYAGLVLVEGQPAMVDAQSLALERLARDAGASPEGIDGAVLAQVWQAWVDLARTDDLGVAEALVTVSALPSDVLDIIETLERTAERLGVAARCWARAGTGLVYARLSAVERGVTALTAAQAALLERWPATTLVAGDPAVERAARPWGAEPASLSMMRALKQRFDPIGTLQPGRYVGGI